jgi:hypothetical protein
MRHADHRGMPDQITDARCCLMRFLDIDIGILHGDHQKTTGFNCHETDGLNFY